MQRSNRNNCRVDPDTALNSDAVLSISDAISVTVAANLIAGNGRELNVSLRD